VGWFIAKVEAHNLPTEQANKIFENFKWGIIETIKAQEEKSEKEAT
jgi:lipopolysaccharide biosynthesis regulator YciM